MGSRGPKPLPANVLQITGHRRPRPAVDLSDGVHPPVEAPPAPANLTPEALAEWHYIIPRLIALNLLTQIDRAGLELYVRAYGRLQIVEKELHDEQARLEAAGESPTGALLHVTPTGFSRPAVLARLAAELSQQVDRYLANFGMSPAARSRVTASRNDGQAELPGFESGPARFFK